MKHGLSRLHHFALIGDGSRRIQIAVKTRKVAARHFQPNPVMRRKHVTRDAGIHADLISLIALHVNRVVERQAIAKALEGVAPRELAVRV